MRNHIPYCLVLGLFVLNSCKSVRPVEEENSQEKGLISDIVNPREARHKEDPWVSWQWYQGARDDSGSSNGGEAGRIAGLGKALFDLDKTRVELVKKNLVDSNGAYGDRGTTKEIQDHHGKTMTTKTWAAMQDGTSCGERSMSNPLYRARSIDGRCNDFDNPPMGAQGERFARNVSLDAANKALKNFHEQDGLNDPNPREISVAILRREDPFHHAPAPFFNLWAAAWIQYMTHDWFAHAKEGMNDNSKTYAVSEKNIPEADRVGQNGTWSVARTPPDDGKFRSSAKGARPSRTSKNFVSHWWDASQVYGSSEAEQAMVRDPNDNAKLRINADGTLPSAEYPYVGRQEISGFQDNWWVGLSLLQTTFVREHNRLVDLLRDPKNKATPPSGAKAWTNQELYETARLSVSAIIAKIHTIEWTPQLIFNKPSELAMNANWHGIISDKNNQSNSLSDVATRQVVSLADAAFRTLISGLQKSQQDSLVSLAAGGSGIVGMHHADHFNSPFTLPEEFTAVYRLHSLLPDYIEIYDAKAANKGEFRAFNHNELAAALPNTPLDAPQNGRSDFWWRPAKAPQDANMINLVDTLRGKSSEVIHGVGINNLAFTFGVTPVGQLTLGNFPRFMTDLVIPQAPGGKVDLAAMDILRDRERGIPRFNEFRRQIQLKPLTKFEDFIDWELENEISSGRSRDNNASNRLSDAEIEAKEAALAQQKAYIAKLKALYKNDIEKVDLMVGIGAEFVRPHGYAISETQFQVFILNASRRLFSDRFFTEAFTPEFYTQVGYDYVKNTTMVDILRRNYPELQKPLKGVANAFEMWNRERVGFSLSTKQKADFLR